MRNGKVRNSPSTIEKCSYCLNWDVSEHYLSSRISVQCGTKISIRIYSQCVRCWHRIDCVNLWIVCVKLVNSVHNATRMENDAGSTFRVVPSCWNISFTPLTYRNQKCMLHVLWQAKLYCGDSSCRLCSFLSISCCECRGMRGITSADVAKVAVVYVVS